MTKAALKQAKKLKTLTLGKNVITVQSGALKACRSLKTLVVTSKKLTKKSVKSMLKGSSVKTVKVKVSSSKKINKKYVAKYKKLFTKKICGKKVIVK